VTCGVRQPSQCDGRITATVEKHVVQWNPICIENTKLGKKEEKKPKKRKVEEKTTKQPLRQVSW
jgi:hypothetical protein